MKIMTCVIAIKDTVTALDPGGWLYLFSKTKFHVLGGGGGAAKQPSELNVQARIS